MTIVSDNFTRANAPTLGANWSSQTGSSFGIATNAAVNQGGFSVAADYWSANTFGNAQFSQVTITTLNGSNWSGTIVRAATGGVNTNYSFQSNGSSGTGNTFIRKTVTGTDTEILAISTTVANGDVLYLQIQGTTLIAKKNGVTVGTVTDSSISTGYPGITGYGGSDILNTWSGGDLTSNSATVAWIV